MDVTLSGIKIECVVGDITRQAGFDAVVCAANAQLLPGGGVAGAIHRVAGPQLAEECRPLGPIQPGQAVITGAYGLPNRRVIHCLGPVYGRDEPAPKLLGDCYRNSLTLADRHQLVSVAFPAISTGIFGYPMTEAAEVAVSAIAETAPTLHAVKVVRIVLANEQALRIHDEALAHVTL